MFRRLIDYAQKNRKTFIITCVIAVVAFAIAGGVFRVNVSKGNEYSSVTEVGLYLIEYSSLPSNYITKDEAESAYGSSGHQPADNKYIGGDRFEYRGSIINYTATTTLFECDVEYTQNEENLRGQTRLVFTYDGEVYATYDHYETFTQLTRFTINFRSNICFILMGVSAVFSIAFCIYAYVIIKPQNEEDTQNNQIPQ